MDGSCKTIPGDQKLTFDYDGFLQFASDNHYTLVRMWSVEHTRQSRVDTESVAMPMPYERTGPIDDPALDGLPKFDLTRLNPAYFKRLRDRVAAAQCKGLYVAVMLFQNFSVVDRRKPKSPWFGHYFNVKNNINGIDGDLNGNGEGREVHTLKSDKIVSIQKEYVLRVIDELREFDNVLYEISNEDFSESIAWQNEMIAFIREHDDVHPVMMTAFIGTKDNSELFDSQAQAISPGQRNGQDYKRNPPIVDDLFEGKQTQVVILDSDHVDPFTKEAAWVWRAFMRGYNPIVLDSPDLDEKGADFDAIRVAMKQTALHATQIDLANMQPSTTVSSTGYALVKSGNAAEYLVYQPKNNPFSVDLDSTAETFQTQWYDPIRDKTHQADPITEQPEEFRAPFSGPAVLHLKVPGATKPPRPDAKPNPESENDDGTSQSPKPKKDPDLEQSRDNPSECLSLN